MKRNILFALLSLIASVALWLYVITFVSPEYEDTFSDITVELVNDTAIHDRNLMVIVDKAPTVTLKLSGNRSDLSKLNSANIKLVADLSRIYEAGEQEVAYSIRYPDNMPSNSFEIVSQDPGVIKLTVVPRKSVTVPVSEAYTGKVATGYMTDKENMTMSVDTVTLTGPASIVDQIAQARVMIDLTGRSESISQEYPLSFLDTNGQTIDIGKHVKTSVDAVHVNLKVEYFKVVTLVPNVIPGGGANVNNTQIKFNYDTITISGSKNLLDSIQSWAVNIDLGKVTENVTEMPYTIELPEGLTNRSGNTVLVTIELPQLETKKLTITNIVAELVPPGMKVDFTTRGLEVVFRGPKSQIDKITAGDVSIVVDFSQAEPGETGTFEAKIVIGGEQFAGIGALGSYDVSATLTALPAA